VGAGLLGGLLLGKAFTVLVETLIAGLLLSLALAWAVVVCCRAYLGHHMAAAIGRPFALNDATDHDGDHLSDRSETTASHGSKVGRKPLGRNVNSGPEFMGNGQ
jgi:hypothetical protein